MSNQSDGKTGWRKGLRHISNRRDIVLIVGGNTSQNDHIKSPGTIWQATAKHRFNDNLMLYASAGSSFRPGADITGAFSLAKTAREKSFTQTPPERSTSYEIGAKTSWLDGRLTANLTAFHQTFKNYVYRVTPIGPYYVSTDFSTVTRTNVESVKISQYVAAVPVTVNGLEFDASFRANENWSISGNLAWANGRIKNGLIPCNDYLPADGKPDTSTAIPTVAQIRAATGGDNIGACRVSQPATSDPKLSANLQSEYRAHVSPGLEAYGRGVATFRGHSVNDPNNPYDDYKAYALVNLYLGLRRLDRGWDLSVFGKNIFNQETVLTRGATPLATTYNVGATGVTGTANYRPVTLTPRREFGVSFTMALGSR